MNDPATMRQQNDEAANRELEQQRRLIARLERRLHHQGVKTDLGTTIQSATEAIRRRLEERQVPTRTRVRVGL